jgi:hypothetical protein
VEDSHTVVVVVVVVEVVDKNHNDTEAEDLETQNDLDDRTVTVTVTVTVDVTVMQHFLVGAIFDTSCCCCGCIEKDGNTEAVEAIVLPRVVSDPSHVAVVVPCRAIGFVQVLEAYRPQRNRGNPFREPSFLDADPNHHSLFERLVHTPWRRRRRRRRDEEVVVVVGVELVPNVVRDAIGHSVLLLLLRCCCCCCVALLVVVVVVGD